MADNVSEHLSPAGTFFFNPRGFQYNTRSSPLPMTQVVSPFMVGMARAVPADAAAAPTAGAAGDSSAMGGRPAFGAGQNWLEAAESRHSASRRHLESGKSGRAAETTAQVLSSGHWCCPAPHTKALRRFH